MAKALFILAFLLAAPAVSKATELDTTAHVDYLKQVEDYNRTKFGGETPYHRALLKERKHLEECTSVYSTCSPTYHVSPFDDESWDT